MVSIKDSYKAVLGLPAIPAIADDYLKRFLNTGGAEKLNELLRRANSDPGITTYSAWTELPDPLIGIHQCRSLLQNLINLRGEHRALQRDSALSEESLATISRTIAWLEDAARIARTLARRSRASQRCDLSVSLQTKCEGRFTSANAVIADLYRSDLAQREPMVQREISNLETKYSKGGLETATELSYAQNILASGGLLSNSGVAWGAIGEGRRVVAELELYRNVASIEDFAKSIKISDLQAQWAVIDAADQNDAAIDSVEMDRRSLEEAKSSQSAQQKRVNAINGSFAERISSILLEYVAVAVELEKRSKLLSANLDSYRIPLESFSSKDLLEGEDIDEKILSSFSVSLATASLNYEDYQSRLVETTFTDKFSLKRKENILTCEIRISSELQDARLGDVLIVANKSANCVISYTDSFIMSVIKPKGIGGLTEEVRTPGSISRSVASAVISKDMLPFKPTSGGIFSYTKLPFTFTIEISNVDGNELDIEVFASISGRPK